MGKQHSSLQSSQSFPQSGPGETREFVSFPTLTLLGKKIEKRLAYHPTAHRLLNYPHFVGTIQVFVDQFLAIPYLRSRGLEVSMVDDDRFGVVAERAMRSKIKILYPLLKHWNGYDIVRQLRYEGTELELGSAGGEIPAGKQNEALKELKSTISELGIFRFDDMYAFAEAYIKRYPELIEILRIRFPWVFVDEMQDTDGMQDRLLQKIFSEGCLLQKYGDINQRIFRGEMGGEAKTSFPETELY